MENTFLTSLKTYPSHEINKEFVGVQGRLYCDGCITEILESEEVWDINGSFYTHKDNLCLMNLEAKQAKQSTI